LRLSVERPIRVEVPRVALFLTLSAIAFAAFSRRRSFFAANARARSRRGRKTYDARFSVLEFPSVFFT